MTIFSFLTTGVAYKYFTRSTSFDEICETNNNEFSETSGNIDSLLSEFEFKKVSFINTVTPLKKKEMSKERKMVNFISWYHNLLDLNIPESYELESIVFPSPCQYGSANDQVHSKFYKPALDTKLPAIIVLHELGGDEPIAAHISHYLSRSGIACLELKLPYYGKRKVKGETFMCSDVLKLNRNFRQAVLDIKRAVDWLEKQDCVDRDKIGICGVSLGGIVGSIAYSHEERFSSGVFLAGSANLAKTIWNSNHPMFRKWKTHLFANKPDITLEYFEDAIKLAEPSSYSQLISNNPRKEYILMINPIEDSLLPIESSMALWNSLGRPKSILYHGDHDDKRTMLILPKVFSNIKDHFKYLYGS